jgi:Asp-tRNA(Asn)/Glu-tRNA(Gln) amidotransferase A subunit family amidase
MNPSPEWTIAAALTALNTGALSAEALTRQFLQHIEERNSTINALRSVQSEQALKKAREIDSLRGSGQALPALAGIPVVIKENCDVAGAVCSAGLKFRKHRVVVDDAAITQILKQQGAIVLGVSISDPGAFSVRTAEVTHPHDPRLTVGGSSGGSAAALASHMCLGAIGTDTGGSIRIPSACCGTVGLKPSFDALPMAGVFPLVRSLDHVGPMARSLADLTVLWQAISGRRASASQDEKSVAFDPRWIEQADDAVRNNFRIALDVLKLRGVTVAECQLPALDQIAAMHGTIFLVESAAYHEANYGQYLADYPDIARNWFSLAKNISISQYDSACVQRKEFTNSISRVLQRVDALVLPTLAICRAEKTSETLRFAGEEVDFTMALVRFTSLFNHTGHPVLTLPLAGTADALSASLQIVGRFHSEDQILRFGQLLS